MFAGQLKSESPVPLGQLRMSLRHLRSEGPIPAGQFRRENP